MEFVVFGFVEFVSLEYSYRRMSQSRYVFGLSIFCWPNLVWRIGLFCTKPFNEMVY